MILYTLGKSVFSRRTRLALAHKGLEAEIRDGEEFVAEAKRLSPQGTLPVLVDDGRVLGDSTVIAHYLDLAYPDRPRLFPLGPDASDALLVVSQVDLAMTTLVELATRYWPLRNDPAWDEVRTDKIGRAQAAIDAVAAQCDARASSWGAAEIWMMTGAQWVSSMPERAATNARVAQILTLGFVMPEKLVAWADQRASAQQRNPQSPD